MNNKRPRVENRFIHFRRSRVLFPTFSNFLIKFPKNGREYRRLKLSAKKTAVSESNAIIEDDTINGLTPLAIAIGIMDSLPNGGNMYAGRKRRSFAVVSISIMMIKNRKISIAPIGDANLNVPSSNFEVIPNTIRRIKLVELLSFAGIECFIDRLLL